MAPKTPYFGKTTALDDAREIVKEQMKRNTQRQLSTDRLQGSLARTAMMPAVEAAKIRAQIEGSRAAEGAGFDVVGGKPQSRRVTDARGASGSASGTPAAKRFLQGLQDGGLTNPIGLAAAMGHGQAESAFNPTNTGDPDPKTGHKMAFGIFQWNNRQPAMRKWITDQGQSPDDPYWQGRFGAHEMETSEKPAGDRLKNAKTLAEANEAMVAFLRPSGAEGGMRTVHRSSERAGASEAWYQTLTKTKAEDQDVAGGETGGLEVVTLPNGEQIAGNYLKGSEYQHMIKANVKLRKTVIPRPDVGTRKGYTFYQVTTAKIPQTQPVDVTGAPAGSVPAPPTPTAGTPPPVAPKTASLTPPGATPAALPNPIPGNTAQPVTAEPLPPGVQPDLSKAAIIVDDEEDDDFDPWTGQ